MTRDEQDSERKPQFGDPEYDIAAFANELTGNGMRWLSTILAAASLGLLVFLAALDGEPAIYYPIHVEGTTAVLIIAACFVLWGLVAAAGWIRWLKKRRDVQPGSGKTGR